MPKLIPLVALLALATAAPTPSAPTATLPDGAVLGTQTTVPDAPDNPVNKFLGIPYAATPQRFAPPTPPEAWGPHTLDARKYGDVCLQNYAWGSLAPDPTLLRTIFYSDIGPASEDCLKLNIYAPASSTTPKPVLIFIPGGGYNIGHGNVDLSALAATGDIIVVSFNYRLNVFGFPPSPEIAEGERNIGLLDQRRALEWVQQNIASFGGDPSRVTVWGQSAGSSSIDKHMHVYGDSPSRPFEAAILSSGQTSFGLSAFGRPESDSSVWDALVGILGCSGDKDKSTLECMRELPAQTILDAMSQYEIAFSPMVDSATWPAKPASAWRNGATSSIPVLTGTVRQEARSLINHDISMDDFIAAFFPESMWPKEALDPVLEYYKETTDGSTFDIATAAHADYLWNCPQGMLANASATNGRPTFRYFFNITADELLPTDEDLSWLGVFHGAEMVLLFSNGTLPSGGPLDDDKNQLRLFMMDSIAAFVKDPSAGPGWAAVGTDTNDIAVLEGSGATMTPTAEVEHNCHMFTQILAMLEQATG